VTKQNLLVVDADPRSLRVLEVSLRNAGYNVAGCPTVGKALEILHASKPDLIISDTSFSDMNGFEFVEQLRQNSEWSQIPFMFLSSDGSIESKIRGLELGVEDYLTKPIYIREVIARVGLELARQTRAGLAQKNNDSRTRFSGSLSEMSVVDLLQTIDVSRKSGVLTLIAADGQEGMISFDSGAVINAKVEDLVGEDAVYRQLLWREGKFDLEFRRVSMSERTVHRTTQALLMEGMRRLDEWSHLSELLPSFDAVLEVDVEILRERLRDIPDEQNAIVRLIDGQRTIGEVLRAHGGDHVEALRKVVDLYFEGMIREVGRIQDSIPILTEVSVRSPAPPPREGVNTLPGPGGLPAEPAPVPAAPRLPQTDVSWGSVPPSDQRSTPVSQPSLGIGPVEASEDEILTPSSPPIALEWRPAPPPPTSRPRRHTPAGFQAVRPESSMYAGGTILNWAKRAPGLKESEAAPNRETVQVRQWDTTLEELRDDPEVEEAIVAIDSDPPPGPFVRSTPPPAHAAEEPAHDARIEYHEPPEVDPPPLTYEQVFEDRPQASSPAPPVAERRPVVPATPAKRSMLPWALLVLAIGCGIAAAAYWMAPQTEAAPARMPAAASGIERATAPETVAASDTAPETVAASDTAPAPAPATAAVTVSASASESASGEGSAPAADAASAAAVVTEPGPAPPAVFAKTGAADTYEAQLALARRLKRGSRAVAAYRRAIELNPESSVALGELARLTLARQNTREAIELAERATVVDPTNALAWVTLGAARQQRGDREGARQAYRSCVKLGKGEYVRECRAMLR
jgi:DNA-binding response OmpR family regulator